MTEKDYKYKIPELPEDLKAAQSEREQAYLDHILELREMLRRDPATGLFHKQEFESLSEGKEGVFIYIDGDNLKLINDLAQSHEAGDTAIKAIGKAMQQAIGSVLRSSEAFPSRMGGDEFSVFLPNVNTLDVGKVVAERILEAIRRQKVVHPNLGEYSLTASVGVGKTRDEADKAMYQAKQKGRNRVEVFEDSKKVESTLKYRIAKRLFEKKKYDLALRVLEIRPRSEDRHD